MATAVTQIESFTFEIERQPRDSFKILEGMQKEHVLCDVTLVAKNMQLPAHKNVLASCSPYFYSMFTNFQTAKLQRVELDVNPQILFSVINYMYSSKLTVLKQNIEELLDVAKMLLLNGILDECSKILERIIAPNNCFHIKRVAANYEYSKLLNSASSYIDDNFVNAVASEDFLNLTTDEIAELISRDTLKVLSEEKVYECVVRWINHDQKERRKHLRHLMGYVRLRFISKDYLNSHIIEDSFLRGDIYCKDLLIKAFVEEYITAIPKPKPRRYQEEEKILIVVGGESDEARNSLEYYDFVRKCWSIIEIPFNIYNAGLVAVNQKLYIIGGINNGKHEPTVHYYDITTESWGNISEMTIKRHELGVGVLNNSIYAVGGSDGYYNLNSVEKFDFQTQKWSPITSMLDYRSSCGVGILNDVLYAVGGITYKGYPQGTVECYDHHTDSWKRLSSMSEVKQGIGVCTLDGRLYAIGGHSRGRNLSTVEEYNPETNSWTLKAPMKVARSYPAVAVVGSKIYVTGGSNADGTFNWTEVYDKITNSWTVLPESMNVARKRHAAVSVSKIKEFM